MAVFFFFLWIILNGRFTVELVLLGTVLAAAVFYFAHVAFGYSLKTEAILWRNLPLMIIYILNLIWEIIKASLFVMKLALRNSRPDPVLIEFDSGLSSKVLNVLLANSITLTPGTYTVRLMGDHFMVHCLVPELSEGMDESSFVKLLSRAKLS